MQIDLDEDSIDWKKKYPEVWARTLKDVEKKQKEEVLQEVKRLGKKKLSLEELYAFQKKQINALRLREQEYVVKKKLEKCPRVVRDELLLEDTGASPLRAIERINNLMEIYYKFSPSEPQAGILERKNDWPVRIDEEGKKVILNKEIKEAFS